MFTDEVSGAEDLGVWDWDAIKYGYVMAVTHDVGVSTMLAKEAFYAIANYQAWRDHQVKTKVTGAH